MAKFTLDGRLWKTESSIPLFQARVIIYIMQEDDLQPTERQQEILASLARLPNELLKTIEACALEYYRNIDSQVNFAEEGRAIDAQVIGKHFRLESLLIPEIRNCTTNYVFATFECDWEEEHGMQILIRDNEVIICGASSSLPFSPQWAQVISLPGKQEQIDFIRSLHI